VNLISVGRLIVKLPRASLLPSVRETNFPMPLPFIVRPSPPPAVVPIHPFLSARPSQHARRPMSGLKPADPPRPSLLPPLTWTPRNASPEVPWGSPSYTFTGARRPFASLRKPLLTFVIPILAALPLYSAPPAMRAAADASRQGWQRAH